MFAQFPCTRRWAGGHWERWKTDAFCLWLEYDRMETQDHPYGDLIAVEDYPWKDRPWKAPGSHFGCAL
jgi:hypothetical protein